MKAMESEIKENVQGVKSDRKETGTQINDFQQKEEINIQPEQNEETRIQKKMRRGLLGNSRTLNLPISESWGCQEEKKSKILKTYLKT